MEWDRTADVVVVGYGGAGGMAAIAAHDAGAKVLLLEKMPDAGGTTRSSGGRIGIVADPEKAVDYMDRVCDGTTARDVLETFAYEGQNIPAWIEALGGKVRVVKDLANTYPMHHHPYIPGQDAMAHERWMIEPPEGVEPGKLWKGGAAVFALLSRNVQERKIDVLLNTPAKRLLTNERHEVIGVEAESNGKPLRVQARRGVILTSGGFSANPAMLKEYIGQGYYLTYCNPGNTGDGIKMAMGVGADLWHMSAIVAGFGYKVPDYPYPIPSNLSGPGYMYVDQLGKRFMNETGIDAHLMWTQVYYWDVRTLSYPRVPAFEIFDHDTFSAGPIGTTMRGRIGEVYTWSSDNQPELERGWITRGETLSELAEKLGLPAEAVQETVARYNSFCEAKADQEFERAADTLRAVKQPPFYGIRVWPSALNTQGGPRRNGNAEVLDVHGQPIPRLYSAGELGSMWHRLYIGAGNVKECIIFGRIAGQNAAGLAPWDS